MKQKLLNFSRNLIIALGLVVMVMILFFTTSSYAASGDTLGKLMRSTVSDWYRFILKVCLAVYAVGYLIIILKLLADRTPERLKIVKESIARFFIMFAVIYFLHIIMISMLMVNDLGIEMAKKVGTSFSGIDMKTDEYDLYQTALSKAYEIAAVPGFIGLLMYLLLVYYTYKFVFVYAKRYINVIVLILLAPIIFVMSTIKRILTGVSDGKIKRWFKEFLFNVIIQTLHAIFYAILIGLTLKMSDNDENLIGALLTLILFGFIFKIDAIVRKIFNFVGGSTNISSSQFATNAINTIGGAVNSGVDIAAGGLDSFSNKAASGITKFGEDVSSNRFSFADYRKNAKDKLVTKAINMKDSLTDKEKLKNTLSDGWDKTKAKGKEFGNKALDIGKAKATAMANSASSAYASAKATIKDANNILDGERVRAKLTADEIVAQQHIIDEAKGLEGLRQKIAGAGLAISLSGTKLAGFKKYTDAQIKKGLNFAGGRVKKGITAALIEMNQDVNNLNNDIEMVKRIPRVIKSIKKHQRYVKPANGIDADVNSTMMLVVDSTLTPEEVIKELKEQYGEGVDVSAFVFEKIGAQAFLSPAVGSPRMGMSVLAENKYEEKAEHKLDELTTGRNHRKRKIGKRANNKIKSKAYAFSRFTPETAQIITNKMLEKSKNGNKYLVVIDKVAGDVEANNVKPRGRLSKNISKLSSGIRIKRKNIIHSVRQIKMNQMIAVSTFKSLARQSRNIELANNVAGAVMDAKNTIRLGFRQIDGMTSGQIGLRSMIKSGRAYELNSGLIAMKQNATVQDKLKATAVVNKKNEIVQFVLTQSGKLARQVVSEEGKIIEPAIKQQNSRQNNVVQENTSEEVVQHIVTLEGEIVEPATKQQNSRQNNVVQENTSEEIVQHIVTLEGKIVEQVVNKDNTIQVEKYQVINNGGEKLVEQLQSVMTNEDLGLEDDVTIEEKINKFQDLLQDLSTQPLLDQVLAESTETEDAIDETILVGMREAGISTVQELKQLTFNENLDDNLIKKKEDFNRAITDHMVSTGVVTLDEAEDEDVVGNALDVLNSRVEVLSMNDSDVLFDKAASMERVRVAEELLQMGEFTVDNPPTDKDIDNAIDKKVVKLSDLLVSLSKEATSVSTPIRMVNDTYKYTKEVFEKAAESTKSEAEIKFEAELMKAEEKWAKEHGEEADETVVSRIISQEKEVKNKKNGEENSDSTVKITLKFFGGVEQQGQAVSLSNRYSIKEFYDKAKKLDSANFAKTQTRFLQIYGEKLVAMQLKGFSFAKNPVADMDGWSIYVVTDEEDVTTYEEEEKEKKFLEGNPKYVSEEYDELMEEYYSDIARIFKEFAEQSEIDSFDDIKDNPDKEIELSRKLRMFFFRHGESKAQE